MYQGTGNILITGEDNPWSLTTAGALKHILVNVTLICEKGHGHGVPSSLIKSTSFAW